jgi:hypothetical protein
MRRGKTSVFIILRIAGSLGNYLRRPLSWLVPASKTLFFRFLLAVFCLIFSGVMSVFPPQKANAAIDPTKNEYWVSIGPVTGSATAAYTYASLFNPSGSGRTIVAKRIRFNSDATAAAAFQDLNLYRTSAASTAVGTQITDPNIPKKNTGSSDSIADVRYATAASLTTTIVGSADSRLMSVVAAGAAGNTNGGKDYTFNNQQLVLQPGEGISLAQTAAGSTNQKIRLAVEWEETTTPTATNDYMLAYPKVAVAATAGFVYQSLWNPAASGKSALISRLNIDVDCTTTGVYTNQIYLRRTTSVTTTTGTQVTSANIPKKHTGAATSAMDTRYAGATGATPITATLAGTSPVIEQVTGCAVASQPHGHAEITFGSSNEALVLQPGEGLALVSSGTGSAGQAVRLSAVWSEQAAVPTAANEYSASLAVAGSATSLTNYMTFFNPSASGKTAIVHRVNMWADATGAAVYVPLTMQRITGTTITGGTGVVAADLTKNNSSSGASIMDLRSLPTTGVTKVGTSAVARLMSVVTPGAVGQLSGHMNRDFGSNDEPIVLQPGQGIVVYQEAAGSTLLKIKLSLEWGEQAAVPTTTNEYMLNVGPTAGVATSNLNYSAFMNPVGSGKTVIFHRLALRVDAASTAVYIPMTLQRISAFTGGTTIVASDTPVKHTGTAASVAKEITTPTTVTKVGTAAARLLSVTTPGAVGAATAVQTSGYSTYDFENSEALTLQPGEGIVLSQEGTGDVDLRIGLQMEWAELASNPTSQGEYVTSTGPITGSTATNYVYGALTNPTGTGKYYSVKRIEIRADRTGAQTAPGSINVSVRRTTAAPTGGTAVVTSDLVAKNSASGTSTANVMTGITTFSSYAGAADSRLVSVTTPSAVGQDGGLNEATIISGDELVLSPGEGIAMYQESTAGDANLKYRLRIVWAESTIPPTTFNHAAYRLFDNQDTTAPTSSLGFGTYTTNFGDTGTDGVAVADFNGDGKKDMALANDTTSNVSILIGNGSGGFTAGAVPATNLDPYDIVAADFNGDGKMDLATNDNGANKVSVLIGSGTGTFAAAVDYSIGIGTQAISVGDFNGDSKPDIVTGNFGASTISVLINTGTGTFPATSTNTSVGYGIEDVVTGDFNGDGKIDIATAGGGSTGKMSVLINSGTGTFPTHVDYTTGAGAFGIATADFTGDGKLDIATANSTAATATIFTNSGTGTFTATSAPTTGTNPQYIVAADYDGDGNMDLAMTANGSDSVSVILGTGAGTFGAFSNFAVDTGPSQIASGDFNGDSKPDLVSTSYLVASGSVLLNTSALSATPIDVSTPLAGLNTPATVASATAFRLRLDIGVSTTNLAAAAQSFKLQYAPMTTSCDTSFVNTTSASYADVTAATTVGYYNNPGATNGMSFATNANDPTDSSRTLTRQTYQESGTTTFSNTTAVPTTADGMWDFALTTNSAPGGTSYCLRVVKSTGTALDTYAVIPEITTSSSNTAPNSPSALDQQTTGGVSITTGAWKNSQSVKFIASATDPDSSDTLALCVEKIAIASSFVNTEDLCGTPVSYTGATVTPTVTITSIPDATQYHWQARLKDTAGLYSGWISFGANLESVADFGVDTTAPTGGTVFDGTGAGVDTSFNTGSLTTLSANWSGINSAAAGLTGYEYSIGTAAGGITVKGWTSTGTTASMTDSALSLQTSQMYYVNVRTTDAAGNVSTPISSNGQVVAPSVSFSVSPSTVTFNHLKASNAYTDTQPTTLTTSTNAYGGYLVRAYNSSLLLASNGSTIGMFNGGTYASPDAWLGSDTGFGYTSNDPLVQGVNKFSPATCAGGGAPPCYAPFTLTAPGDIVADHATGVLGTAIAAEPFILTYQVKTTATQAATNYKTATVYSVTPIY